MRVNQYIAHATGLSRRAADAAVAAGRVKVNGEPATPGHQVGPNDAVQLDKRVLQLPSYHTVMFHKPVGYVTSRRKQGSTPTIYKLLPDHFHQLKPIGRLDKDSSGLLLLTNDGALAQSLQHPSQDKAKVYTATLNLPLKPIDLERVNAGIELEDGISDMKVTPLRGNQVAAELIEGRNRQVRRTFEALGYKVKALHRTSFGDYQLGSLPAGKWRDIEARA